MKPTLAAATVLLSLAISANAQISKNQKYDWGWSYKLEMPESGLKCEFPEKPSITTLAYGYMTAASYKDELYMVAKLENPNPYDITCRTEEFVTEMKRVHGLPIAALHWNQIQTENGHLTVSADAAGKWAQFHVDAIATEDVLTIFIYANHGELTVPGHFFASSYSVYDIPAGNLSYLSQPKPTKRAKVLEYDNGRSLVRLENSAITLEWPAIPTLQTNRHQTAYSLEKNGSHYATRVIETGPEVSYAFFNTFVSKEHQKLSVLAKGAECISYETEVLFDAGMKKETYLRKVSYKTNAGTTHRYYVAAGSKIIVQELSSKQLATDEKRYLNTFEQSVRNQYDTRAFAKIN